ncbi:MAG: L,D-transpeptidase family protein [Alistipes sp.]|nr:L,D-transpeptidase family protein [Alistipes sp.]
MIRAACATIFATMLFAAAGAQLPTAEAVEACGSASEQCRQAVVVEAGRDSQCDICFMERTDGGEWICRESCRGTVGINGVTPAQLKCEGDGCTPCGTYALRRGLWRTADVKTLFPMECYDEGYVWIDDRQREDYNTLVRGAGAETYAHGERLAEVGEPYDYIVVVEYNTCPVVKGAGSAIFLHVWRAEGHPTAGCVAMPAEAMRRLVGWLDPKACPEVIITARERCCGDGE